MLKFIIGAVVGGAIGFGIGYLGKCSTGACPLTGNPIVSTTVGVLIGIGIAAALKP
ncbi:MAG: DUF6132 family protein [Candidatus Omnitrophica bacterium]|nr:DUF6132 family protein [Candidatus Omnitrophota bacterium]